ncbi:MAG TPA: DUF1553 domain-containing protein [Pirellulaceae bacterium]|nr:DUF1553 domain-containing protein [Pirellulaceae bacterium]
MLRLVTFVALLLVLAPAATQAAEKLQYNRDIRPILTENCFACHGADSASRKADLRLDVRDDAIEMDALRPGNAAESELLRRILSADPEKVMPPPHVKKTITAQQRELLQRWITEGAEYQPHWAFIAPQRPAVPTTKQADWVRQPLDAYVLAKLEAEKLAPAPEADRRTLARRVALDLTGLPPAPADLQAFVGDQSPEAYEKYVDKLLASQAWGEHRARYWLDAARYADTHGIHFDNYREIWAYREGVIAAFNRNQPFDQFTIEQIAGDLLPNRTIDQQIASGFNRCNITTNEGGSIAEEYLVLYTRDRTEATSAVWLGLTTGCAVCHDHKFDPLSQREFYSLAAFFNNTTQGAMDGNIKDTPPILPVPKLEDRQRFAEVTQHLPIAKQQVEARKQEARPAFDQWLTSASPELLAASLPTTDLHLQAKLDEGEGKVVKVQVDGQPRELPLNEKATWQTGPTSRQALQVQGAAVELADAGDFEGDQAFTVTAWIKLPAAETGGAIAARMDNAANYRGWDFWVQRRQVGTHIIHDWPANAVKVVSKAQIPADQWTHVAVSYDGSRKAAGVKIFHNGQLQQNAVESDKLTETTRTNVPFKIGQRNTADPLNGALQDLRIYKRALAAGEVEALAKLSRFQAILAKPAAERKPEEQNELYGWWLQKFDDEFQKRTQTLAKLEQDQNEIRARGATAYVMQERNEMAGAFILNRGEYDQRRDAVQPATPAFLPPMPDDLPRNRLGFAQWLLRPEHPLMARVTVNRIWQELFGAGLVRTSGDFGITGEVPSHPELLDHLAIEFREKGWDLKQFYKTLVMSSTYRQAALATPEKIERDPHNRWLSRGPRFRMDAEMVRDYALAASGLLVNKLGGPSVKPYQPEGVWEAVAMIGSNTRDYRADAGENLYRRSMYTFWKRAAPPASMEIFNAPAREFCTVRRERTNTPLQALVTLNDPQFIEAARYLAQQALLAPDKDDTARVQFIAERLLARPLSEHELKIVQASLTDLTTYYAAHADDAAKLITVGETKPNAVLDTKLFAAWTMLTNELMNLDEVLNK